MVYAKRQAEESLVETSAFTTLCIGWCIARTVMSISYTGKIKREKMKRKEVIEIVVGTIFIAGVLTWLVRVIIDNMV